MIATIRQIKKLAVEMRAATSSNDVRYEKMRDQIYLCDEVLIHFTDDER